MTHMPSVSARDRRVAARSILGTLVIAVVVACSSTPLPTTASAAADAMPRADAAPTAARDDLADATIDRPRARWVAASWADLPGWSGDRVVDFWPAFLRSCERPTPPWLAACAKARLSGLGAAPDERGLRDWLQK